MDLSILSDPLEPQQKKLVDGVVEGLTGKRPRYEQGPYTVVMGAHLAEALLGDRFTTIEACNGLKFEVGPDVLVPTVSPEALFGHEDGLLLFGKAITASRPAPGGCVVPPPDYRNLLTATYRNVAVDTEGTPEDPICLSWSDGVGRYIATDPIAFWRGVKAAGVEVIYHNAVWDWSVMEAMGIEKPWEVPYHDTLVNAYWSPGEPKGLKDLGYRYLGIKMPTFQDVVMPHYNEKVLAHAEALVATHSVTMTRYSKGRLLKKSKVTVMEEYLPIARALKTRNTKLLAQRMGWWDGQGFGATGSRVPSLREVPKGVLLEYATLDAFVTHQLWERQG